MKRRFQALAVAATTLMVVAAILAVGACSPRRGGESVTQDRAADAAGIAGGAEAASASPATPMLRVVASTDIVGDVAGRVGGDSIALTVLIDAGRDPHGYQPTPREISRVSDADIVFINGLGLEEGLADVIARAARGPVVAVSDGVPTSDGDPHTWMSPLNVKVWVENVRRGLSEADPSRSAEFSRNASAYLEELDRLDSEIREAVAQLEPARRQLVTDHREFGYFAREYGFLETGFVVPASSTSAEAGPAAIAKLVELMRSAGVPAIFVGVSAPDRVVQLAEAVASETGAQVVRVQSGSLAPPGEPGDTYTDLMRLNTERIVDALAER